MSPGVETLPFWPVVGYGTGWTLFVLLAVWVIRLILTGRLITRQQVLDTIADRDHWREASTAMTESYHQLGMAVHDLGEAVDRTLTLGEATNHALTEIQSALERIDRSE